MSPDLQPLLKACFDFTGPQEGNILWPYLDNATNPNVTIGRGHLLYNVTYAANVLGGDVSGIQSQWDALRACKAGELASAYENVTSLRISQDKSDELFNSDLWQRIFRCRENIAGFVDLPVPAQVVIVDIDFNVKGGVKTFPSMLKAAAAKDWPAFTRESDRPQLPARSKAVRDLLAPLAQSAPVVS